MSAKGWRCGNCGHETDEQTDKLLELNARAYSDRIISNTCPCCGSYVICQAWDDSYTAGRFLVVRTHNRIVKGEVDHE